MYIEPMSEQIIAKKRKMFGNVQDHSESSESDCSDDEDKISKSVMQPI